MATSENPVRWELTDRSVHCTNAAVAMIDEQGRTYLETFGKDVPTQSKVYISPLQAFSALHMAVKHIAALPPGIDAWIILVNCLKSIPCGPDKSAYDSIIADSGLTIDGDPVCRPTPEEFKALYADAGIEIPSMPPAMGIME